MLFCDMPLEIVYCVSKFYMISLGHAIEFMLTLYVRKCVLHPLGRKQASNLFNYHALPCNMALASHAF